MKKRKLLRRIFTIIKYGSTGIILLLALDMIIARSIYHPLTYVYHTFSWLICQKTASINCQPKSSFSSAASGDRGAVVTSQHLASEVGLNILQQGGNAIDAAVTVGFTLAVTLPRAGNLGGGGFMLIHLAENSETVALDYREKAPLAASRDMFLDENGQADPKKSRFSHLAVGVPGTVAGMVMALEKYGTISLERALQPAIELAEKGFVVDEDLRDSLLLNKTKLQASPESKRIFYKSPDERLMQTERVHTFRYALGYNVL